MVLKCSFGHFSWTVVGSRYTCFVASLLNPEFAEVTDVVGNHTSGLGHNEIEAFHLKGKDLTVFPKSLEVFFPRIILIDLINNQLTSISSKDFAPWQNLKFFSAQSNKIKTLDDNLFENNRNIAYLDFSYNLITNIGKNFLSARDSELNELTFVDFRHNLCIDMQAQTPQQKEELESKLLAQCPPLEAIEETSTITISSTTRDSCNVRCSMNSEVDDLEALSRAQAGNMEKLDLKSQSLETLAIKQAKTIEDLLLEFDSAKQEINRLRESFTKHEEKVESLEKIIENCQCAP